MIVFLKNPGWLLIGSSTRSFVQATFLFFLFLLTNLAVAQTTYYSYNASAGANWNSSASWSTVSHVSPINTGTFPGANDIAIIGSNHTIQVNINSSCNTLIINGSGILSFTTNSTLTVGTGGFTLDGTGQVTATTTNAGRILQVNGSFTVPNTATGVIFERPVLNVTGITSISGSITFNSTTNLKTFSGDVMLNSGSTWNESAAVTMSFGGNFENNTSSFTASTGTHTFAGANKIFSGASTTTIPNVTISGTYTNDGTLTIGSALSGTGTLTQGTNATLNIGGSSGITTLTATASGNTVNYTGAAQTINGTNYYHLNLQGSGAKTLQTGTTSVQGNLTLSGTATAALVTNISIGGDLTVNSGTTLTLSTYTADRSSAGGTLSVGGTLNVGGSFPANYGTVTLTGSTVNYNGTGSQIVRAYDYNNLTLSSARGANNITLESGTIRVAATFNTTATFAGGGYSTAGNTVELNGSGAQNIGGTGALTLNNLITSGSGTKSTAGAITCQGNLTIKGGTAFSIGAHAVTISGTTTVGDASSATLSITSATGAKTFNDITLVSSSSWSNSVNAAITVNGSIDVTGGTFSAGTGVHTLTGTSKTLSGTLTIPSATINGTYTNNNTFTVGTALSGTGTLTQASNATLTIGGTSGISNLTATANGNTVNYNASGAQTIKVTTYQNLTLSGSGNKTSSSSIVINGVLSMEGTAVMITASPTFGSSATLQYKGSAAQNTTSIEFPATFGGSGGLVINNSNGVTLDASKTLTSGGLTLTSGRLTLGSFNLTIASGISGTPSVSNMVVTSGTGMLIKSVSATGAYTFPISASGTNYTPVTINITAGTFSSATVGARVSNTKHPNNASTTNYLNRYWTILQSGITGCVATVTGTYVSGDIVGTESSIGSAQLNGTFNQTTNPWIKFSALNANTLTATGATLTSGTNAVFTGIELTNPTVTISGGGTICSGSSTVLTANPVGLATFIYSWSPATGLSSTTVANPTASPASTTTYTVTVRDGNGITATNNATVTVDPVPTINSHPSPATQTVCKNAIPTTLSITATATSGNVAYQWYSNTINSNSGGTLISGATSSTYTPPTTSTGTLYYYNVVSQTGNACTTASNTATVVVTAPNVTGLTAAGATTIMGDKAIITVGSSNLTSGTYTVLYNILGANAASNKTATLTFTAGAPGSGTFLTQVLSLAATNNQVQITQLTRNSDGCSETLNVTTAAFTTSASKNCVSANGGGNWHVASSWTDCGGGYPLISDNATITAGNPITVINAESVHNLTLNTNASLNSGTGNPSLQVTGDITINGTIYGIAALTLNGHDKTISGVGNVVNPITITVTNNKSVTAGSNLYFTGSVSLSASTEIVNNGTITIGANITGSSTSTSIWTNAAGSTLNIGGTSSPIFTSNASGTTGGTLNASASGNTVHYFGNGNFHIASPSSSSGYPTYHHLSISGGSTKTLPDLTTAVNGDLTLNSTLNGNGGAKILRIRGNWINNSSTGFTEGFGTVIFDGTTDQYITKSSLETFNNLIVDKAAGTLYLNANVKVGSTSNTTSRLTLTNGNINCGAYTLTLGQGGSNAGSVYTGELVRIAGTIIGKFQRYIESPASPGGAVLFPVGTSSYYRPAAMTFSSSDKGSVIAEFVTTFPGSNGLPLQDTDGVFSYTTFRDGYWALTAGNSLDSVTYTLSVEAAGFTVNPPTVVIDDKTRIVRRQDASSGWAFTGNHVTYISGNIIQRSGISVFGHFGLGDDTNCSTPSAPIFTGLNGVCASVSGVTYTINSPNAQSTYTWELVGHSSFALTGSVAVNGSDQITVSWGSTPIAGSVKVFETNSGGCSGQDQTLNINVQSIPPAKPIGKDEVPENVDGLKLLETYTTSPQSYYTGYLWEVTGGTIITNSGNSISVQWGTAGTGTVKVKGITSCGTSESSATLTVNIYNLIFTLSGGSWSATATSMWSCNCVPQASDNIFIKSGHTVTITNPSGVSTKNLIISGTLNTGTNNSRTLTVTGNLIFNSGTLGGTIAAINLNSGIFPFLTIDGTGTISNAANLNFNFDRTFLSSANVTISSAPVAIASGVTVTNNGIITLGGTMTGADATSTWTNAANSTLNYGGTNLLATGTLNASATDNLVHYNGGSGQNIKEGQYYKLSFSGTGSKTLPLGTVSILNDFTNNATMVAAGTVNFNGTSSILGATPPNFNNLTVSGALTSSSGTINVAGAFTNNGTFNHNNGTVNFNGTAASIAGSSITFNNLSVSSGTLTPSPISFNVIGDFTNDAIFSGNGSTVVFTGSNAHILGSAVPDFHNLTISGTLTSSSGTINIAGNFTDNGTFNHNNGTVRFNGAASNILGSSPLSTFYKLTVGASSSANIGKSADLLNELNVEANGTFDAGTSPTNIFSLKSTSDDLAADASIGKLLNGAQVIGNVRVERYMSGEGRIYRYLSSPVQNAKVSDWMDDFPITGNFTDPTVPMTSPYFWPSLICGESILSHRTSLWFYNEPSPGDDDAGYRGYPLPNNSSTTSTLQVGRGYVAFIRECDDPTIVDVRGPINSGTINLPVTFTKHSGANGIGDGWNLVGNPYPAPILWDAATGWSKNRISQSIAIRDNSINNGGNFFKYYDGTDPDDFNGVIAQGQGFWIRTQEGTGSVLLQINENAKANGNAHSFYRQAISQNVKNSVPSIVISMEKNGLVDKAYIRQRTNSIMELDEWDAPKLKNELFGIATVNPEGIPMAINAVPLISDGFKIPIHIADSIDSPATIAFSKQNGFEEYAVELTDKLDGVKKILQWNEPYNFMSIGSNPKNINRFEARLISSQNSPKETFTLTAYPNPVKDELTLVVPDETGKYKIDIFDNRGIKLPDLETRRESQMLKINFSLTSPGLYLIRVTRDSHISWTKVIKE